MEASRELDALIAEKVFGSKTTFLNKKYGWCVDYIADKTECNDPIVTDHGHEGYRLKRYSSDLKSAWEIVEKLKTPNLVFSLCGVVLVSENSKMEWLAKWEFHNPEYNFEFSFNGSVPMAICEATLKALDKING